MAPPPVPAGDDPTILDGAILWRRIYPGWWCKDPASGNCRLSTAAFDNSKDGSPMSVAIAAESPGQQAFLKGYDGYGIAAFTAGFARHTCGQVVARDPAPEEPWHAYVIGAKTYRVRKLLRDESTMVVIPRAI